jgi:16S rRNA (adenine1518-N6/adenine1519-N6)-dimethyltransferase
VKIPGSQGRGTGEERHRPRRSLGQNFLVDRGIQRRIVEALEAGPDDTVLEIGPGRGALTDHLAGRVGRLVLVELDRMLAGALEQRYAQDPAVEVLQQDILDVPLAALTPDPRSLRVIGNIPYNVTTPILFHVLEPPRPAVVVVMIQDEVADRILAEPGGKSYGALSVGVRAVARVERVMRVHRGVFRPVPGVDSAVIRITPLDPSPVLPGEEQSFRGLVRSCFQWRRKQMGTILRDHPDLTVAGDGMELLRGLGIDPRQRPETLAPELFLALVRAMTGGA